MRVREGSDGRRIRECSGPTCRHNYKNQSRDALGRKRYHFKLTKEDYVRIHREAEDFPAGSVASRWGISRSQIKRILNLNLSDYSMRVYGEPPCSQSTFSEDYGLERLFNGS